MHQPYTCLAPCQVPPPACSCVFHSQRRNRLSRYLAFAAEDVSAAASLATPLGVVSSSTLVRCPLHACDSAVALVGLQILLPYVIGCLFGIGYGSVVAAGGWEALRVPATPDSTASSAAVSGTDRGRGDGVSGSGGTSGRSGGGNGGGGGCDDDGKRDISFAAQVCAWDSRAEEEAHADGDEDDEDDDLDSSGLGSDNDDALDGEDHRGAGAGAGAGGGTAAAAARATSSSAGAAAAAARGPARMTRSQARSVGFKDGGMGVPGSSRGEDEDVIAGSGSGPMPDAPHVRGSAGSGQGGPAATAAGREGVGGGGGGEQLRRVSLVHHASSYDSPEADDDEEDEEDDSGWGQQVVVKPVKVARWDKLGLLRSKALLSLNQLRACIIERAESTPQKATYRRAAKLVSACFERERVVVSAPPFWDGV